MTVSMTLETKRLRIQGADDPSGQDAYTFKLFRSDDGAVPGTVIVSALHRPDIRTAHVHCQINPLFLRQGYATEALPAVLTFVFTRLDFQQIEAFIHPDNEPALAIASRLGLQFRYSVLPDEQPCHPLTFVYHPSVNISSEVHFDFAAVSRLRQAKQYHATKALVASYLHQAPDDPLIHYQMAWCHDNLGEEAAAVPHYVAAIELGLPEPDLQEAYVGLGSTYRALGRYDNAYQTLTEGLVHFPNHAALQTFLALTLHNLDRSAEAIERLIGTLVDTTENPEIRAYGSALRFYASRVNETWDGN
ncbi:tetratricopeptide repeat protein [Exiguobacterium sp. RIT594]|uniref:tetratricopeptide repeat protein n=1 Tax=Exiguobacterium sp. RIT594 TaxID=2282449 RepID=UPI000DF7CE64|nr:tetratricopeptide repeat protein [Exiguobacterium sp. RIT594]RDB34014.1 GNAT family N-acetyltransferase [Exiguobacterium sp. RIT594]